MFDHISLGVADIARAKAFYDAALEPLGHSRLSQSADSLGYGRDGVGLWLLLAASPSDPTRNRACMSVSRRPLRRPSIISTPPRCAPAGQATARPASGPTTATAITRLSSSIPTAIGWRPTANKAAADEPPLACPRVLR